MTRFYLRQQVRINVAQSSRAYPDLQFRHGLIYPQGSGLCEPPNVLDHHLYVCDNDAEGSVTVSDKKWPPCQVPLLNDLPRRISFIREYCETLRRNGCVVFPSRTQSIVRRCHRNTVCVSPGMLRTYGACLLPCQIVMRAVCGFLLLKLSASFAMRLQALMRFWTLQGITRTEYIKWFTTQSLGPPCRVGVATFIQVALQI